jgi:hypothetical protein
VIDRDDDFFCEIDVEWTHNGNLFRMTCDDFTYDDFDRIKLFLYLPLALNGTTGPWVELCTGENFAEDFWDPALKIANEQWEETKSEAMAAWANDASGC